MRSFCVEVRDRGRIGGKIVDHQKSLQARTAAQRIDRERPGMIGHRDLIAGHRRSNRQRRLHRPFSAAKSRPDTHRLHRAANGTRSTRRPAPRSVLPSGPTNAKRALVAPISPIRPTPARRSWSLKAPSQQKSCAGASSLVLFGRRDMLLHRDETVRAHRHGVNPAAHKELGELRMVARRLSAQSDFGAGLVGFANDVLDHPFDRLVLLVEQSRPNPRNRDRRRA